MGGEATWPCSVPTPRTAWQAAGRWRVLRVRARSPSDGLHWVRAGHSNPTRPVHPPPHRIFAELPPTPVCRAATNHATVQQPAGPAAATRTGEPRKKPGSRGGWLEGRELDRVAEVGEPADEPSGLDLPGTPVEVVGPEVRVGGAVLEHVVGGGQDRGRHRAHRPLRPAAGAQAVVLGLQGAGLLAARPPRAPHPRGLLARGAPSPPGRPPPCRA